MTPWPDTYSCRSGRHCQRCRTDAAWRDWAALFHGDWVCPQDPGVTGRADQAMRDLRQEQRRAALRAAFAGLADRIRSHGVPDQVDRLTLVETFIAQLELANRPCKADAYRRLLLAELTSDKDPQDMNPSRSPPAAA